MLTNVLSDWALDAMDGQHGRNTGTQCTARHVYDHLTDGVKHLWLVLVTALIFPWVGLQKQIHFIVYAPVSFMLSFWTYFDYSISGQLCIFGSSCNIKNIGSIWNICCIIDPKLLTTRYGMVFNCFLFFMTMYKSSKLPILQRFD
jgi:hypothetical protein